MVFKCVNCGGNVVYSPEKHKMYCPYCESEESARPEQGSGGMEICPDCGGQVPVREHTAAIQCPYCSNYIILDERVTGDYLPGKMIPFQMGRETCKKALRDKFKKSVFAPTDFLSEARLNRMEGVYVPFWFYDYDVDVDFQGEGTKVRSWTSGNMSYTETSYYDVRRDMDIRFRDIPVDASVGMPDDVMDLMEPYDYRQLIPYEPKYLSGFLAEKYNMGGEEIQPRARQKMTEDINALVRAETAVYNHVNQIHNDIRIREARQSYGFLPVWRYLYKYAGQEYPFYVNGQTGKIVGTVPLSAGKVWAYAGTIWACLTVICLCLGILGTLPIF